VWDFFGDLLSNQQRLLIKINETHDVRNPMNTGEGKEGWGIQECGGKKKKRKEKSLLSVVLACHFFTSAFAFFFILLQINYYLGGPVKQRWTKANGVCIA